MTNPAKPNGPDGPDAWRQITAWAKMANGDVFRVVTTTADRIGYSTTAGRKGWPKLGSPDHDIELWQTFLIYHALYRTGRYDGSWEDFVERDSEVVQPVENDNGDDSGDAVDPTQPTPLNGS